MSKTAVSTIITRVKRKADYNISDTDLDNFIIDEINSALKVMKQWLLDAGLFKDIGAQDSFTTTADTNYIDLSSTTIDFDEPVVVYEKTNDRVITIIPYEEFVMLYPDDSANKSTTPDHCAFFDDKLFLGPTPSVSTTTIYLDYVADITEVTSGSTCPFRDKYDPLLVALCVKGLAEFLEPDNANRITAMNRNVEFLSKQLITTAARNMGQRTGTASRKPEVPYFAPRKVIN